MIVQELEQLLARDVEAFIDGRWQVAHFIGFGPGYSDDDVEITVMTTTHFANRSPMQKNHTFICKQSELATRIRHRALIQGSVTTGSPTWATGTIPTNTGNDKKCKFHVGDRVLVTVELEQIVNEPATVENVNERGTMYWCIFDKQIDPQWFVEERLQAR